MNIKEAEKIKKVLDAFEPLIQWLELGIEDGSLLPLFHEGVYLWKSSESSKQEVGITAQMIWDLWELQAMALRKLNE
ncbi:MAG: hypothetical protein ACPGYT_11740 [Nitrospirales bacterium]